MSITTTSQWSTRASATKTALSKRWSALMDNVRAAWPLSTPIHFSKICVQTHDTKTFSTALACHNSNFLTLSIYARHLHPEKASRVREPRGCLTNSRRAESVTCNQVSNRFFGQLAFVATVNHWTTYLVQSDFGLALSPVDRYPSGMSGKQPWS